jgi:hypothetical protein
MMLLNMVRLEKVDKDSRWRTRRILSQKIEKDRGEDW